MSQHEMSMSLLSKKVINGNDKRFIFQKTKLSCAPCRKEINEFDFVEYQYICVCVWVFLIIFRVTLVGYLLAVLDKKNLQRN